MYIYAYYIFLFLKISNDFILYFCVHIIKNKVVTENCPLKFEAIKAMAMEDHIA